MSDLFLSDLWLTIDAFHFLRPIMLVLLLPLLIIWWLNRRAATSKYVVSDRIAPHLLKALTVGEDEKSFYLPIDHVALVLALAVFGAAGPSWTRQVDPFTAQTGPVVIVLEVTPSMTSPDLPPDRLERAKFKIRDLLDLRAGARTALVAYAGSAHRVLSFTEDAQIMLPYIEGLTPDVMPVDGADARTALTLAEELLADEGDGGILFVLDGLYSDDAAFLNAAQDVSLTALAMLPEGVANQGLDMLSEVTVIRVTADSTDVERLDRILNVDFRRALLQNSDQPWEDRGWWLAVPAVLLSLVWFRKGWTMRWVVLVLAIATAGLVPVPARADGFADWFLTPDQQGFLAIGSNNFERAAELFDDPLWRGHALYRLGRYDEAVEVLDRLDTAEASFTKGLAHIKNRQYRDGVRSFETTLKREPGFPGAAENLQTAIKIVEYVEAAREASDTGDERGIGADDVVFDNEAGNGTDMQTDRHHRGEEAILTTEQWMNTVDTRTSDFLRFRFRLEAAEMP
jgi:Ca-activated chloride channel family protein